MFLVSLLGLLSAAERLDALIESHGRPAARPVRLPLAPAEARAQDHLLHATLGVLALARRVREAAAQEIDAAEGGHQPYRSAPAGKGGTARRPRRGRLRRLLV
jgi:hypothetical protein